MPPSGPPVLSITVGDAVAGAALRVVIHAAPHTEVTLAMSTAGTTPVCPDPSCERLIRPTTVESSVTDWEGEALLLVDLPPAAPALWFQALDASQTTFSAVVEVDPAPDGDGDGLSDDDEAGAGTRADLPDTDGDGATDLIEVLRGLDPLAPDGDGDGIVDGDDTLPGVWSTPDPWTPDERWVTTAIVHDPELSPAGLVTWQTPSGSALWVAQIDRATGAFIPSDGRGERLDDGLTPFITSRNGPEWANGPGGPQIIYSRRINGRDLLWRAEHTRYGWRTAKLTGNALGYRPHGSIHPRPSGHRLYYRAPVGGLEVNGWRDVERDVVHPFPYELDHSDVKFSLFDDWHMQTLQSDGAYNQVVRYDLRTDTWEMLTSDAGDKSNGYLFPMPEWGGEEALFALRGTGPRAFLEIVVYRQIGGTWQVAGTVSPPAAWPYVVSPELFSWHGRSYVVFVAGKGFDGLGATEAQIFVAALDPAQPLVRRVSGLPRLAGGDPEVYVGDRPFVYYTPRETADGPILGVRLSEVGLP